MFGKLKEKLKSALNVFSRKAEEEVQPELHQATAPEDDQKLHTVAEVLEQAEKEAGAPADILELSDKEEKTREVPETFNPATLKFEPDLEKIKAIEKKLAEKRPEPARAPEEKTFFKKAFTRKAKEKKEIMPQEEPAVKEEKLPEKESFLRKLKTTLTTKTISAEKFDELFWELELALLENNVSVEVIQKIKEDLKHELVEKPLPRDVPGKIRETLRTSIEEILSMPPPDIPALVRNAAKKPFIIAFFGINGSGKTLSVAKIAFHLQQQGYSVVLAACDTFRAAAIQQLEEHAQALGVKMIKHDYGSDAAAVAFDAVRYAQKNNIDVVLIDTAGRLHSNVNLMGELKKIIRVVQPDLKLFVGESITGNDCIEQARRFHELAGLDGCILTKADVDEKGGAPLSIAYVIRKPILFVGTGQKYGDLKPFTPELVAGQLGL